MHATRLGIPTLPPIKATSQDPSQRPTAAENSRLRGPNPNPAARCLAENAGALSRSATHCVPPVLDHHGNRRPANGRIPPATPRREAKSNRHRPAARSIAAFCVAVACCVTVSEFLLQSATPLRLPLPATSDRRWNRLEGKIVTLFLKATCDSFLSHCQALAR